MEDRGRSDESQRSHPAHPGCDGYDFDDGGKSNQISHERTLNSCSSGGSPTVREGVDSMSAPSLTVGLPLQSSRYSTARLAPSQVSPSVAQLTHKDAPPFYNPRFNAIIGATKLRDAL